MTLNDQSLPVLALPEVHEPDGPKPNHTGEMQQLHSNKSNLKLIGIHIAVIRLAPRKVMYCIEILPYSSLCADRMDKAES